MDHNPFGGPSTTTNRPGTTSSTNPPMMNNNLAAARVASLRPTVSTNSSTNPPPNSAQYAANPFVNPQGSPATTVSTTNPQPTLNRASSFTTNTVPNTNNNMNNPFPGPVVGQGQPHPQSLTIPPSSSISTGGAPSSLSQPLPVSKTINDYVQEYLAGPQLTTLAISLVSSTPSIPIQNAPNPLTSISYIAGVSTIKPEVLQVSNVNNVNNTNDIDTYITIEGLPNITHVLKAIAQQQYGRIFATVPSTATLLSLYLSSTTSNTNLLSSLTTACLYIRSRITALFLLKKYSLALSECNSVLGKLHEIVTSSSFTSITKDDTNFENFVDTLITWIYLYSENLAYNGYWRESVSILHNLVRYFTNRLSSKSSTSTSIFTSWSTENMFVSIDNNNPDTILSIPICESLLSYIHITMNTKGLQILGKHRCSYYLTVCTIKCSEILAGVGYTVAARNIYTETIEAYDNIYTTNSLWNNTNDTNTSQTNNIQCTINLGENYILPTYISAIYKSSSTLYHGLLILNHIQLLRAMNKDTDVSSHIESLEKIPGWKYTTTSPLPTIDQIKELSIIEAYCCTLYYQLRATIHAQAMRLNEALPLFELALHCCGRILLNSTTTSLKTKDIVSTVSYIIDPTTNNSGLASSITYLSPIPDPYDLLNDLILAIVDCIRRGPPAGALPPSSIALDFLHASIRSQPVMMGRPTCTVPSIVGTLLETSRDPATALLAKRVIQGVAIRYGINHIDPTVFRLNPTQ